MKPIAALIAAVLAPGTWAALPFPADSPPATVATLSEASGVVWHAERQKLYAVSDGGTLWELNDDGSQLVGWGGLNDVEGVTYADPASDFVYLVRERPTNAILEFDIVAGAVRRTFDLTPWIHPADANQGAEAITFVPEAASAEGGYFYVGVQEDGIVRLFELPLVSNPLSSTVTFVRSFSPRPGRTDISDMDFDRQNRILYVLWDNADRLAAYRDDDTLLREWDMYTDAAPNQEGIAIDSAGRRLFSCEDDSNEVYVYTGFDFEADRLPLEVGDGWRYFKGTQAPPSNWRSIGFDDSGWLSGPSGFGYGPDCAAERGTALPDMRNGYVSLYARHPLRIDDPARVTSLTLTVDFDDAFVAYLNGVEVARNNVTGNPPAHTQVATANRECSDGLPATAPGMFALSTGALVAGANVLAIQGHNQTLGSSDFTLTMSLAGVEEPGCAANEQPPGEVVGLLLSHSGGVGGTTSLSWQVQREPGASAVVYDTIRSTSAASFASPASASCVEADDGSDTAAHDSVTPASDSVHYFLVRAENGCGHGALGSDSSGTPRLGIACP